MRAALVAVIAFALLFSGNAAEALRHPAAPRCPIFPKSNPWNQRVDRLPVAAYDEVARGRIDHALRFTVRRTRRAYVYPARHFRE